jgi:hypothetical protein
MRRSIGFARPPTGKTGLHDLKHEQSPACAVLIL